MKRAWSRHHNQHLVIGGRREPTPHSHLRFSAYLKHRQLRQHAPSVFDYSAQAKPALEQMYLNDRYGCCVPAALYHSNGVLTGNAGGEPYIANDRDIICAYSEIGGFDPNHPDLTDLGCDEVTALNWSVHRGYANGVRNIGWLSIEPHDTQEVLDACWLWEGLLFGIALPDEWIDPMPDPGFTWDVAGEPQPTNGHALLGVGGDSKRIIVSTWGMLGSISLEAVTRYAASGAGGGVYAMISPAMLLKGQLKAPNGVYWNSLIQDFITLGGQFSI